MPDFDKGDLVVIDFFFYEDADRYGIVIGPSEPDDGHSEFYDVIVGKQIKKISYFYLFYPEDYERLFL